MKRFFLKTTNNKYQLFFSRNYIAFKKKKLKWHTIFWFLEVAREKYLNLKKAEKGKNKGRIVICDRYPQTMVEGINDGPKLGSLEISKHKFWNAF